MDASFEWTGVKQKESENCSWKLKEETQSGLVVWCWRRVEVEGVEDARNRDGREGGREEEEEGRKDAL